MPQPPRDHAVDNSLALLREGYVFGSKRFQRLGSDIVQTRLMLRDAFLTVGTDAAELFYARQRLTRRKGLPLTALTLLQDKGSVQMLDGEAHRRRKEMFLSLMDQPAAKRLARRVAAEWQSRLPVWERARRVVLLHQTREILCRAVCDWAGVPLTESELAQRTREFAAMIDGAGAVGPRNWRGQILRARNERWARSLVERVRRGDLEVADATPLRVVASHRDLAGGLLPAPTAAVELINILRPTVAVSNFIVFAALALHDHPRWANRVRTDDRAAEWFVQEVRRFYPFFPMVGARTMEHVQFKGASLRKGSWLLLDLYATNRDRRIWDEPGAFRPERFEQWDDDPFSLVPQGGGDHAMSHRCAGEWITIEVMKTAVRLLTTAMHYDVPPQNLRIDLSWMPGSPRSGFVITAVRRPPASVTSGPVPR